MGTVNINLGEDTQLNLILGQQLENAVTEVVFDFSAWQTAYGSGTLGLSVQRHGDAQPYAVVPTVSGTDATWSISDLDTARKGVGEVQVTYTVGTVIKKSVVYKFTVYRSLGENGEYPSPGQTWQEEIEDELADVKQGLQNLQEEIEGGGSGMSVAFKQALHNILEKVAYIDGNGQTYLDALDTAMFPPVTAISLNTNSLSFATLNSTQQLIATTTPTGGNVTWSSSDTSVATVSSTGLVTSIGYGNATITATSGSVSASCSVLVAQATLTSITCAYTQSGVVYDSDSLDSLKSDLVVTAHWSNSTTSTVADADYTLSGTLTEGTSTITVTYGGKTTTFTVTVSAEPLIPSAYQQVEYIKTTGTQYIVTDYTIGSRADLASITVDLDFAFDEWNGVYATNIMMALGASTGGVWIGYANGVTQIAMGTSSGTYFTTGTVTDRHQYTYSLVDSTGKWTRDDNISISRTLGNTNTFTNVELFYHIVAEGTQNDFHFAGKLYSCVVYKNGAEVLNLIPCYRKSDDEIGLYDIVNNRFYTNDGTGTFLKGSDVA